MSSVASVQAPAEQLLTSEPCSHARFGQQITGRPTQDDIDAIESPFAATMLESLPPVRARSLREVCLMETLFRMDQWRVGRGHIPGSGANGV
eukprot:3195417-Pyramimonas_sp.AAC.1